MTSSTSENDTRPGTPETVPDDGLTTRQRRNRPVLAVHTGEMKGKSTAAFGMALRGWANGMPVAVFQFVKSGKWKVGEEQALRALGRVHEQTGEGGAHWGALREERTEERLDESLGRRDRDTG